MRDPGGIGPLEETLRTWRTARQQRSRAMLDDSAELARHLDSITAVEK